MKFRRQQVARADGPEKVIMNQFQELSLEEHVVGIQGLMVPLVKLIERSKVVATDAFKAFWPGTRMPEDPNTLLTWLSRAPFRLQEWRRSAARAGSAMALYFVRSWYPQVDLDRLAKTRKGFSPSEEENEEAQRRASIIASYADVRSFEEAVAGEQPDEDEEDEDEEEGAEAGVEAEGATSGAAGGMGAGDDAGDERAEEGDEDDEADDGDDDGEEDGEAHSCSDSSATATDPAVAGEASSAPPATEAQPDAVEQPAATEQPGPSAQLSTSTQAPPPEPTAEASAPPSGTEEPAARTQPTAEEGSAAATTEPSAPAPEA